MIRPARYDDLDSFVRLWKEYLTELHDKHEGSVLPTVRTMDFFSELFIQFVSGRGGVCLVAEQGNILAGVLLWGSPQQLPFDSKFGKIAHGWGTYVVPALRGEHVSSLLRKEAKSHLKALGFNTVVGSVAKSNVVGEFTGIHAGFEIVELTGVMKL